MAEFKTYEWDDLCYNPDEDYVYFHTNSLLSKWGFCDGDMLGEHDLLQASVKKFVIPKIDQSIEYAEDINLAHNPIRATKIDGVDVRNIWFINKDNKIWLTPDIVKVSKQDIEEIWQSLK